MGEVSGYTMHLYCDHTECMERWNYGEPYQFSGSDRKECVRDARTRGWIINRAGRTAVNGNGIGHVLCPRHSGKKP